MASILILSEQGQEIPIGYKLAQEGHLVKIWFQGKTRVEEPLQGVRNPSRVRNPFLLAEHLDLILSSPSLVQEMEQFQQLQKRVLGCSRLMAKLMTDKEYSTKAFDFLKVPSGPLVGISCRVQGFITPKGLSPFAVLYLNSYRFMDKNKGVQTPGMGGVAVSLTENSKLHTLLLSLEELLLKAKHLGPINLTLEINTQKVWVKEIDSFLYHSEINACAELLKDTLFQFLHALQEGHKVENPFWDGIGLSVVASTPPWPYLGEPYKIQTAKPPEGAEKHFSLGDPSIALQGVSSARGQDIREARRRVYRTLDNSIQSSEVQYREDIGLQEEKDLKTLGEWGWV